jgi:hypothetical protein
VTRAAQIKVLFVTYGSGHVKMIVPLAQALSARPDVECVVLALTTAAPVARSAGLKVIQFKDFVIETDAPALERGRQLMQDISGPVADPDETVAYLGLSMDDLIHDLGKEKAHDAFAKLGRQAFLPLRTLERILRRVNPELVVATNSPRAERAAIMGARKLGIPSVCLVDLFAIDEVKWIGAPDYADQICVLNEEVRAFLISKGREPTQVSTTGNPAFDALNTPTVREQGRLLRLQQGWDTRHVILWPTQVEPPVHPIDGRPADITLPDRALAKVVRWTLEQHDAVLCIRARAGESVPAVATHPRIFLTGQDWPLAPLLHAVDIVATVNSTVGLEGYLSGCRVIQVLGSVFDESVPMGRHGIADAAVALDGLTQALDYWSVQPRRNAPDPEPATGRVLAVIDQFLAHRPSLDSIK